MVKNYWRYKGFCNTYHDFVFQFLILIMHLWFNLATDCFSHSIDLLIQGVCLFYSLGLIFTFKLFYLQVHLIYQLHSLAEVVLSLSALLVGHMDLLLNLLQNCEVDCFRRSGLHLRLTELLNDYFFNHKWPSRFVLSRRSICVLPCISCGVRLHRCLSSCWLWHCRLWCWIVIGYLNNHARFQIVLFRYCSSHIVLKLLKQDRFRFFSNCWRDRSFYYRVFCGLHKVWDFTVWYPDWFI